MRSPTIGALRRAPFTAACLAVLAVACNRGDRAADSSVIDTNVPLDSLRRDTVLQDTSRGTVELPSGSRMDDSTRQVTAAPNERAPRDTNQLFLRMMVDHHQGLIVMSDSLLKRSATAAARNDARQLREQQEAERQEMQRLLAGRFNEERMPRVMASNREMIDSVRRAPRGEGEARAYYRQVIAHHREGIAMVQPLLAALTGDVKAMAERMVAAQEKEIEELRKKAGQKS